MFMSAEHDNPEDELLQQVIAELRRPVRLDADLDQRALARIRAETGAEAAASPIGRRWGPWLAGAAIAAGLLLTVALPARRSSTPESDLALASRHAESAADARSVRLRLAAPASSQVAVVGDFNDWDPAATPLHPTGDGDTWIVELRLKPGRYHYTFLVDGRRWERDPSEPPVPDSDFGAPMSVLTVS
jgi:hypothetical protein